MAEGVILLLDDDQSNLDVFSHLYEQYDIPLTLKTFKDIEKFRSAIRDKTTGPNVKAVIFDLVQKKSEEIATEFEVSKDIKNIFDSNRIPIFIHSAYIHKYSDFEDKGTVFKIPKSAESTQTILDKIKLFHDSGFFDIFCPRGIIESKIMTELHNAFIKQFHKDEIENIIKALKETGGDKYDERVIEVFTRISIRALMTKLIAPYFNDDGVLEQTKINAAEAYVRRINDFKIWTGDIFEKKDKSEMILLLTPRCDIASKNKTNILACKIFKDLAVKKDEIQKAIVDNIRDKKYRFLPKTPLFGGGKVDLSSHITLGTEEIQKNYNYMISLSDELTNEITGKFCSYFMRTGISEIDQAELLHFFENS